MAEKFLKIDKLYQLLGLETFILLGCLIALTYVFYKIFLREASEERHKNIKRHLKTILNHYVILSFLFAFFLGGRSIQEEISGLTPITPYLGLLAFIWGNVVFVKTSRLIVLQYLFLGSMKHGVPLLLVNIFSLLLSIVLFFWGITHVFGLELGPLLATSAAASVILGLALQDTLGNLFAGISLQLDRNFEIGDWLEVVMGLQRATGQVKEISWRSTTLVGFSDELITLPNRYMANATISNFSPPENPIVSKQIFKLAHGANVDRAKEVLERVAAGIGEIRGIPAPWAYVSNLTENWVELKIIYFIDNFSAQFAIGDKIYTKGTEALQEAGVKLARQHIEISDTTLTHERS